MPSRASLLALILMLLPLGGCTILMVGGAAATGTVLLSERRSPGTFIDDNMIEITATDRIYADPILGKRVHLKVTSYDRVVLLTGEVPDPALRRRALDIVRNTRAVRAVLDETRIAPPAPLGRRLHDRWLVFKIKTALLTHGQNPLRTRVVVDAGNAYLLGQFSDEEANAVSTVARSIRGVRRLVLNNRRLTPAPTVAHRPEPSPPPAEPEVEPVEVIPYADSAAFETAVDEAAPTSPPSPRDPNTP